MHFEFDESEHNAMWTLFLIVYWRLNTREFFFRSGGHQLIPLGFFFVCLFGLVWLFSFSFRCFRSIDNFVKSSTFNEMKSNDNNKRKNTIWWKNCAWEEKHCRFIIISRKQGAKNNSRMNMNMKILGRLSEENAWSICVKSDFYCYNCVESGIQSPWQMQRTMRLEIVLDSCSQ